MIPALVEAGLSVESNVFVERDKMPDANQIQRALKASDFDLVIDTEFDVFGMVGFVPCTYQGEECGFEYSFEDTDLDELVDDGYLDQEERATLCSMASLVTLSTRSGFRDGLSATLVCAVVCALAEGMWADGGEPPFISATEAIAVAKKIESAMQADIAKE